MLPTTEEIRLFAEDWAPLAEWGVAIGTILLAAATAWLARHARDEARSSAAATVQIAEQVQLQREQMDRAMQPLVYPLVSREWAEGLVGSGYDYARSQVIPVKNGGPGLALNVHGACFKTLEDGRRHGVEIHGGTIEAGGVLDARLESAITGGWLGIEGFLTYHDLAGEEWATHFRFGHGRTKRLIGFHDAPARVRDNEDPRARYRDRPLPDVG